VWTAVLLVLVFGGVALVGSFLMARRMVRPIQELNEAVGRIIRDGDLTQEIQVRSTDEIGQLAASFGGMVRKLREVPLSLQESANVLTTAVKNLTQSTGEQSRSITQQATALQETQVTAQEIKQTSLLAAQKAATVLSVAERADELARNGETAIEMTMAGLNDIRQQVGEIAQKIVELGERTQQIGGITQTVKDLADQSNMLALNAAIEAVRSGEHGKGFAVVATEVKSLAEQSRRSTAEVRQVLGEVQKRANRTVLTTEESTRSLQAAMRAAQHAGEVIRQLADLGAQLSQAVAEIAHQADQQVTGIGQINGAVRDISQVASQYVSSTKQAELAAKDLSSLGDRLRQLLMSAGR
jgi:methyl-accepting chemotaxis protein